MDTSQLKNLIRTIPDYPKPGIMFRDITTLLKDPAGFKGVIDGFVELVKGEKIDYVVGIESRGFPIGGAVAYQLGAGLVMARKQGKLPHEVIGQTYELEYGTDTIEIHKDALAPGDRCLIIDDLIATGGTAEATCKLVDKLGAKIVACAFIVNLPELKGADRIAAYDPQFLVSFEGH